MRPARLALVVALLLPLTASARQAPQAQPGQSGDAIALYIVLAAAAGLISWLFRATQWQARTWARKNDYRYGREVSMFRNTFTGFVFGVLMVCPIVASSSSPLKVHEDLLGQKADAKPIDWEDIASPDGERVAWRERTAKRWVVKVNGDPMGPEFQEIEWVILSPDGEHVAYRGKQGKNWVAVVDGKPGSPYREIGAIRFSPDSQRVAYAAKKGKKWVSVADGEEGEEFDDVGSPGFSPDSQHLVYPAKRKKKWVMIVDGNEQGPELREVPTMVFVDGSSAVLGFVPENQAPVYVGRTGKAGWSVFKEYLPGPEFDIVAKPDFFDTAGARFVYAGARVEKPFARTERAFGTRDRQWRSRSRARRTTCRGPVGA